MATQSVIDELNKEAQDIEARIKAAVAKVEALPKEWLSQVPALFQKEVPVAEAFLKTHYGYFALGTLVLGFVFGHVL